MFKWHVYYREMTAFLYISQYMLANPTVNLSTVYNSCAKNGRCSSDLMVAFPYAGKRHPKCERATHLVCPPFFPELPPFIQTHKAKSNRFRSADSNTYFRITKISHMFIWNFFSALIMTDNVTSQSNESSCIWLSDQSWTTQNTDWRTAPGSMPGMWYNSDLS